MIRGVHIKKAFVIAEDDRRKIFSIMNGELNIKDLHLLEMKKGGSILGQHKHWYAEVCFVYKGSCHYWLKNKEGETLEVDLVAGDIMYRAPEVVHTCTCTDDCVLIDGACESWVSEDWNHVREELVCGSCSKNFTKYPKGGYTLPTGGGAILDKPLCERCMNEVLK